MIEQGLSQQRMWYTSDPTFKVGSDISILGEAAERSARDLCESMKDIVVAYEEVDNAAGEISVTIPAKNR